MLNIKVTVIPVVIGALGMVPKTLKEPVVWLFMDYLMPNPFIYMYK